MEKQNVFYVRFKTVDKRCGRAYDWPTDKHWHEATETLVNQFINTDTQVTRQVILNEKTVFF